MKLEKISVGKGGEQERQLYSMSELKERCTEEKIIEILEKSYVSQEIGRIPEDCDNNKRKRHNLREILKLKPGDKLVHMGRNGLGIEPLQGLTIGKEYEIVNGPWIHASLPGTNIKGSGQVSFIIKSDVTTELVYNRVATHHHFIPASEYKR